MASVTRRARRRTQVSSNRERVVVNARRIESELVSGDFVPLHVVGICVAICARFCNIQWIDRRLRTIRRVNIVRGVTIRANRNARVSLGQEFSMHACLILAKLVRA